VLAFPWAVAQKFGNDQAGGNDSALGNIGRGSGYARTLAVIGRLAVVYSTALAAFATVFWEALQLIGTWYVTRGLRTASPVYGVFAVVITLLSWIYPDAGTPSRGADQRPSPAAGEDPLAGRR
jgi:hypothetical protein